MDKGFDTQEEYEDAVRQIQSNMRKVFSEEEIQALRAELQAQIPEMAYSLAKAMMNFRKRTEVEVKRILEEVAEERGLL